MRPIVPRDMMSIEKLEKIEFIIHFDNILGKSMKLHFAPVRLLAIFIGKIYT